MANYLCFWMGLLTQLFRLGTANAMKTDAGSVVEVKKESKEQFIMLGRFIISIYDSRARSYNKHTLVDEIGIFKADTYFVHKFVIEKQFERILLRNNDNNVCHVLSLTFAGKFMKEDFSCDLGRVQALVGCNTIIATQNEDSLNFYSFTTRNLTNIKTTRTFPVDEILLDISKTGKLYFVVTTASIYHLDSHTLNLTKVIDFYNRYSNAFTIEIEYQVFLVLLGETKREVLFYRYDKNLEFSAYFRFTYEGEIIYANTEYIIIQTNGEYNIYNIGNLIRYKVDEVYRIAVETNQTFIGAYKDRKSNNLVLVAETQEFGMGIYNLGITELKSQFNKETETNWWQYLRQFILPILISLVVVFFTYKKVLKKPERPRQSMSKIKEFIKSQKVDKMKPRLE